MKGFHIGDKVRIKNDNCSNLKVGSVHSLDYQWEWKEQVETVWSIDGWLFEENHLELIEKEKK